MLSEPGDAGYAFDQDPGVIPGWMILITVADAGSENNAKMKVKKESLPNLIITIPQLTMRVTILPSEYVADSTKSLRRFKYKIIKYIKFLL